MSCNCCSQARYFPFKLATLSNSWHQYFDSSALDFRIGHSRHCLLNWIWLCAPVLCFIRKCATEAWIETVMAPDAKTLNHMHNLISFRSCQQFLSYCRRWTSVSLAVLGNRHGCHLPRELPAETAIIEYRLKQLGGPKRHCGQALVQHTPGSCRWSEAPALVLSSSRCSNTSSSQSVWVIFHKSHKHSSSSFNFFLAGHNPSISLMSVPELEALWWPSRVHDKSHRVLGISVWMAAQRSHCWYCMY